MNCAACRPFTFAVHLLFPAVVALTTSNPTFAQAGNNSQPPEAGADSDNAIAVFVRLGQFETLDATLTNLFETNVTTSDREVCAVQPLSPSKSGSKRFLLQGIKIGVVSLVIQNADNDQLVFYRICVTLDKKRIDDVITMINSTCKDTIGSTLSPDRDKVILSGRAHRHADVETAIRLMTGKGVPAEAIINRVHLACHCCVTTSVRRRCR